MRRLPLLRLPTFHRTADNLVCCAGPARDTGLSPYELVYGTLARTPLDVIYTTWRDDKSIKVGQWVDEVCDHLDALIAYDKLSEASSKRKRD